MPQLLDDMGLKYNPFEPAATGAPVDADKLWLPESWTSSIRTTLDTLATGTGAKVMTIVGEYGSGKSYILQWLRREELPTNRRIQPFYFDNPGVQFYDLANALLRQIGRKDFTKALWELAADHVEAPIQRSLFSEGYEQYLRGQPNKRANQLAITTDLQNALIKAGVTDDEEVAHRFGRIIAETIVKPYFEHRDFIPTNKDGLVAEKQEAKYFAAILRALRLGAGATSIAFLIDEFEEISLQRTMAKRDAHDYLVTLKRLINLTTTEDLWLALAMTRDAFEKTQQLAPDLQARFSSPQHIDFEVPPLSSQDAIALISHRIERTRPPNRQYNDPLHPFTEDGILALSQATLSNPRHLVKVCFKAIAGGGEEPVPFAPDYLRKVEKDLYPSAQGAGIT